MTPPRLLPLRFQAPTGDGEQLAWPALNELAAGFRTYRPRFSALQRQARAEFLKAAQDYTQEQHPDTAPPPAAWDPERPILVQGHQPEWFHPGVWAKYFALVGLARATGGTAVSLVVDQDLARPAWLKVPVGIRPKAAAAANSSDPAKSTPVQLLDFPLDDDVAAEPYETRQVQNRSLWASVPERLSAWTRDWPEPPVGLSVWSHGPRDAGFCGEAAVAARRQLEFRWGVPQLELPVSRLVRLASFAHFVDRIEADYPRFRQVYHAALADYRQRYQLQSDRHPAANLAPEERPFWHFRYDDCTGRTHRDRPFQPFPADQLRPRALTLTWFVRAYCTDLFLHGLGGGLYDQVTDQISEQFFGQTLPRYGVLTMTHRLPLPAPEITPEQIQNLQRQLRDARWNPQRWLPPESPARDEFAAILAWPTQTKSQRRTRTAALRAWKTRHAPGPEPQSRWRDEFAAAQEALLARQRILRREASWLLYPESFLQRRLTPLAEIH